MQKVIDGDHPGRLQGAEGLWFVDDLLEILGLCWSALPGGRPTIEVVFDCLKRVSPAWRPLPPSTDEDVETDTDDEFSFSMSGHGTFPHPILNPGLHPKGGHFRDPDMTSSIDGGWGIVYPTPVLPLGILRASFRKFREQDLEWM